MDSEDLERTPRKRVSGVSSERDTVLKGVTETIECVTGRIVTKEEGTFFVYRSEVRLRKSMWGRDSDRKFWGAGHNLYQKDHEYPDVRPS